MVLEFPQERALALSGQGLGRWPHDHLRHHRDAAGDDVSHSRRLPGRDFYSLHQPGKSHGDLPLRIPDGAGLPDWHCLH